MSTQAPTRRTGFRHRAAAGLTALILPLAAMVGLAAPAEAATAATATYTKVSDWGTGFEGKWTVKNTGTTALSSWTVEWDYPAGTAVTSASPIVTVSFAASGLGSPSGFEVPAAGRMFSSKMYGNRLASASSVPGGP